MGNMETLVNDEEYQRLVKEQWNNRYDDHSLLKDERVSEVLDHLAVHADGEHNNFELIERIYDTLGVAERETQRLINRLAELARQDYAVTIRQRIETLMRDVNQNLEWVELQVQQKIVAGLDDPIKRVSDD